MLLRGNAQREARQREELLRAREQKSNGEVNVDKKLTLRQRRLLLLDEDQDQTAKSTIKSDNGEKEADDVANHTLR